MSTRIYFPQIKCLIGKLPEDILYLIDDNLKEINGWNDVSLEQTCREGRIDIVRYIHENFPHEHEGIFAIDEAAEYGHLNIIKYLYHNNPTNIVMFTKNGLDKAIEKGYLDVVEWFAGKI